MYLGVGPPSGGQAFVVALGVDREGKKLPQMTASGKRWRTAENHDRSSPSETCCASQAARSWSPTGR